MHNQNNDTVTPLAKIIARNTFLLAASMAALYAKGQLVLAVAAVTFATLTGALLLAGLKPALFILYRRIRPSPG